MSHYSDHKKKGYPKTFHKRKVFFLETININNKSHIYDNKVPANIIKSQ